MADKAGDLLDRDTRVLHKRDEAVPVARVTSSLPSWGPQQQERAERTADVPCIERGAYPEGKHQVIVMPPGRCALAELVLTIAVDAERAESGHCRSFGHQG